MEKNKKIIIALIVLIAFLYIVFSVGDLVSHVNADTCSVEAGVHDKRDVVCGLLKKHEVEKESTLYIGDMPHDIDTARYAGIKSVAVLGGFGKKEELEQARPDYIIENISELIKLVEVSQ